MTNFEKRNESAGPNRSHPFPKKISRRLPSAAAHMLFWLVAAAAFALDLLTKWVVFERLSDRSVVPVIDGVLRFVVVHNEGAAFGLFAGHPNWLIAVSFVALAVILCIFVFSGTRLKIMHVALALFAAGICGNLYDRLFNNGLVRDFIDVGISDNLRWPAFNLADSFLCVAVGLMMIAVYLTERPCRKHAQRQK